MNKSLSIPLVGIGFDAHKLIKDTNTPLYLAGLQWDSNYTLDGHSDGDVAIHAICNALLSSLALGDIGTHFPTISKYKNISSINILKEVLIILKQHNTSINNISLQLVTSSIIINPKRIEAENKLKDIIGATVGISASTGNNVLPNTNNGIYAISVASINKHT